MDGEAPKKKWRFLQKYWHKGAFFQEASDNPYTDEQAENIFWRDYSNPTGEDKMDKTVLPKIMQVSKYGHTTVSVSLLSCSGSLRVSGLFQGWQVIYSFPYSEGSP